MDLYTGDDSDGAKGFQLESFRMPNEDVAETKETSHANNSCDQPPTFMREEDTTPLRYLESEMPFQLRDRDEALVTMFISKEAAAQFAGADKHFPGRPPTARPRGAPPPRSARANQGRSKTCDLAVTLPARPSNQDRRSGTRSSGYLGGKSPLLMAQLPPRKQQHDCFREISTPSSSRGFGNSTYGSFGAAGRKLGSSSNHSFRSGVAQSVPPSTLSLSSGNVHSRPFAWGELPLEHNHDDRPIITEAVRSFVVSKKD